MAGPAEYRPTGPSPAPAPPAAGRKYAVLALLYGSILVYGCFVPLNFRSLPLAEAVEQFRRIPVLRHDIGRRADLVANFVLFVPLTFLAMGALTAGGRRGAWVLAGALVAALNAALSVAIEFVQVYLPSRTVSMNDLVMQILGGSTGVVAWFVFGRKVTAWAARLGREDAARHRLAVNILRGYAVWVVLYMLFPFDVLIRPAELWTTLRSAKVVWVPFTDRYGGSAYVVLHQAAVIFPVGYLAALGRLAERRRLAGAAVSVLAFCIAIEAAQVFVWSRYTSTTDVLIGFAGGLGGILAAARCSHLAARPLVQTAFWARAGRGVLAAGAAVWLALLAWEKFQPFNFTWPAEGLPAAVARAMAVPLSRQHGLSELNAVAQIVREWSSFALLGMLLRAIWRPARRGALAACAAVACLPPAALELVQVFLPSRTADLTAILLGAIGAVMGVRYLPAFTRTFLFVPTPGYFRT